MFKNKYKELNEVLVKENEELRNTEGSWNIKFEQ